MSMGYIVFMLGVALVAAVLLRLWNPQVFHAYARPWLNWKAAIVLWAVCLLASISASFLPGTIAALLFAVFFWATEVQVLMEASNDAFAGPNDKLLWGLFLLFCPPVGLVLFRSYRERNWAPVKKPFFDWI